MSPTGEGSPSTTAGSHTTTARIETVRVTDAKFIARFAPLGLEAEGKTQADAEYGVHLQMADLQLTEEGRRALEASGAMAGLPTSRARLRTEHARNPVAQSTGLRALTQNDFTALLAGPRPVLVEFGAPWCPPCRDLLPKLDRLSGEYEGRVAIARVEIDEQEALTRQCHVLGIPTLIGYANGRERFRLVGDQTMDVLRGRIDTLEGEA